MENLLKCTYSHINSFSEFLYGYPVHGASDKRRVADHHLPPIEVQDDSKLKPAGRERYIGMTNSLLSPQMS